MPPDQKNLPAARCSVSFVAPGIGYCGLGMAIQGLAQLGHLPRCRSAARPRAGGGLSPCFLAVGRRRRRWRYTVTSLFACAQVDIGSRGAGLLPFRHSRTPRTSHTMAQWVRTWCSPSRLCMVASLARGCSVRTICHHTGERLWLCRKGCRIIGGGCCCPGLSTLCPRLSSMECIAVSMM